MAWSFLADGKQKSPAASSINAMSPLILLHAERPDVSNRIKGAVEPWGYRADPGSGNIEIRTGAGDSEFWDVKPWKQSSSAQGSQIYIGK